VEFSLGDTAELVSRVSVIPEKWFLRLRNYLGNFYFTVETISKTVFHFFSLFSDNPQQKQQYR
jgi:hypothetical protein